MKFLLSSFYFFYFAIIGVSIIFLPKVLDTIGYTAYEIGIIFASAPFVRLIIPFLFIKGLKLDRAIFNKALILMSLSGLSFFLTIESFYLLILSNIALGVALSLSLPYVEVIALELIGKKDYGKVRLFGSIGFILVALVLVKFLDGANTAIGFLSFLTIMTAISAYSVAKYEKSNHKNSSFEHKFPPIQKHYFLWIGFILMQISFGPFYNFFTIYETDNGVSLDTTIYLWSFGVVVEVVLFYFQAKFFKYSHIHLLQFSAFLTAFRWLLVYFFASNISILYFSQSLHAFSFALFHSASIAFIYELYKSKKLAAQLFFGLAYGGGAFLGAFYSGYVYEYYPNELFLSAFGLAFLCGVFMVLFEKRQYKPS